MNDPEKITASIRYQGAPEGMRTTVWINGLYVPGVVSVRGVKGFHRTYTLELEVAVDDLVVVDVDGNTITRPEP